MSGNKRVALVTGAGKPTGIGYEVCRQLASAGFHVVLTARNADQATARAAELRHEGLDVVGRELDITNRKSVYGLAKALSRLDVLVNNAAGVAPYGEIASSADLEVARQVMETTVFGTWSLCISCLPLLRQSPHGRIVNVSSGAGSHGDPAFGLHTGNGMGTSYAVAKAALNALTVKLALEEKSGVLINAVCPGFTATFEGGAAMGARAVSDGAAGIVWAALLPEGGPNGGFFRDGKPLAW